MKGLHVDSIRKSYKDKLILSDIFLTCTEGEIIGLIGRNGSGKSTLLKIIFGIENAENKFIRVDGKVLNSIGDSRKLINYLPQQNFLPEELKVITIIKLFLPKNKADLLLKNDMLQPVLERKFRKLSTGEKRILEILLLLYSDARFILLDEPFEGVSPLVREEIIAQIEKQRQHKGFIITDHDYRNVLKIASRALLLKNGSLKEIQDENDLLKYGYVTEYSIAK